MPGINDNIGAGNIELLPIVDEVSDTEFYIGTSGSFNNTSAAVWRIKKIWQDGSVWMSGYANGDQGFNFVWDLRATDYIYS